jgi:hypothetical protein
VGCVTEDDDRGAVVVGLALDADEREVWVAVEGVDELGRRDEGGYAGEMLVKEGWDERAGAVGF